MTGSTATDRVQRFGSVVRNARKEQGLTQAELARLARVSRVFIIEVEAGHPRAELGKALAVLGVLGIQAFTEDRTPAAAQRSSRTKAGDRLAFSDAALALAGHQVSHPALRSITERAARGDLTAEDAIAEARRLVQE